MSDLERLIEIARVLPAEKVHALLTVAEQMTSYAADEEFLRTINSTPPLDVDEQTAAELRAALSERGETIGHDELKRALGLP
jgi:predicted secreted Zn-dependent protease